MPVCDGCGAVVDDAHIRARIERLEMATRYRPIHIQVLLLDAAPATRLPDYFYFSPSDRSERSVESRAYFEALIKCAGDDFAQFSLETDALAEFQKRGLFLTNVAECPVGPDLNAAVGRCAPSLLKRIQFSYKPKYLALVSPALASVIPLLSERGWAERLILNAGAPFNLGCADGAADLAHGVKDKLVKTVANRA